MTSQWKDFLELYEAVEVPDPVLTIDAIDPLAIETTEAFFRNIQNSLQLGAGSLDLFFERDMAMLVPAYEIGTPSSERVRATDDFLAVFKKRGQQVIASVLAVRDDFNYQVTHFTKYPLLPQTIEDIRELQRFERINHGLE